MKWRSTRGEAYWLMDTIVHINTHFEPIMVASGGPSIWLTKDIDVALLGDLMQEIAIEHLK